MSRVGQELPVRLVSERLEAGVDEVGRGCLAGPVVAAAVILDPKQPIVGLHDSKTLTAHRRQSLLGEIRAKAIAYAIAEISPQLIDQYNILEATYMAMNEAVQQLSVEPEYLLIDGNRFKNSTAIPFETLIKGDDRVASIAAASILAKEYRDQLMWQLATEYPEYDWAQNVGYGTPKHLAAIQQYGITPQHRKSFAPCQPRLL